MKMHALAPRSLLMVGDSAKILKRLYFTERECIMAQAGWIPGTVHWETKILWPEMLWQNTLTANAIRERVLELRFPERRMEAGSDAAFLTYWQNLLRDAPSDVAFAQAMLGAIKPFMRSLYLRYLEIADRLDDAPTVRILQQAVRDLDEQLQKLGDAQASAREVYATNELNEAQAWALNVRLALAKLPVDTMLAEDELPSILRQTGVVTGRSFSIAREGMRDPRFAQAKFPWPDALDPSRGAGEGFELQVRQAEAHLNEIWAAEMAAAVIYDLAEDAPAEFLLDAARWCFDEVRHCRMGYTRFLEWGFDKREMPLGSFAYDSGAPVDAITRLGIIYYFETTYIHTKSERTRSFAEFGDRTSSHDMDFDWADELIHTHYGKKWLDHFISAHALKVSPNDVKVAAAAAITRIRSAATPADRLRTETLYKTTMARARDLAAATPPPR